jgi:lipopolysaccharide transport system permease protein
MTSSALPTSTSHDGGEAVSPGPETLVIEAQSGWSRLNLADLWRYRELIYFMTWRDIKVRYKQTVLGAAWAIVQPVVNMIVFSVIFGRIAHLPSSGIPYPLFTFTALLPWTYFAYVLQQSGNSLVNNANMISKVYFPRLVLPLATLLAGLVDFVLALLVLVALMLWYHIYPGVDALFLPLFLLLTMVTALGAGTWFAALSVKYRDVKYVLPVVLQVWLYASPVAYSAGLVKGKFAVFYLLNPLAGVIDGFRWCLIGVGGPPRLGLVVAICVTAVLLSTGLLYFSQMEHEFADVI